MADVPQLRGPRSGVFWGAAGAGASIVARGGLTAGFEQSSQANLEVRKAATSNHCTKRQAGGYTASFAEISMLRQGANERLQESPFL